jgi:hypothetical protein
LYFSIMTSKTLFPFLGSFNVKIFYFQSCAWWDFYTIFRVMSDEAGLFLLKKLPACWRGLFDCSMKHNSSTILHRMNEWYQGQTSSQFGGILDWDDLIQSLVVEEPLCTDNSLVLYVSMGTSSITFRAVYIYFFFFSNFPSPHLKEKK